MTSRLQRWGERALGRAHVVEPRIASRFEQAAPAEAGVAVQHAAADMSQVERARPRVVATRATPSEPVAQEWVAPTEPVAQRSDVARTREPSRPAQLLPPSPRVAKREAPERHAKAPARTVVVERLPRQLSRTGEARPGSGPDERAADAPQHEPRSKQRSLEAALAKLQAWMERDEEAREQTQAPEASRAPELTRARTVDRLAPPRVPNEPRGRADERASRVEPSAAAPIAAAPLPPRVEVHIGTIVVRVPSTAPAPSPRAHPAASLASFLTRRTAGRL